jgi:hypothetical protein
VLLVNTISCEERGWPADFHEAARVSDKSKAVISILHEQNRLQKVSLPELKKHAPQGKILYFAWVHAREFEKEVKNAPLWFAAPDEPPLTDYLGGKDSTRLLVSKRDSHTPRLL